MFSKRPPLKHTFTSNLSDAHFSWGASPMPANCRCLGVLYSHDLARQGAVFVTDTGEFLLGSNGLITEHLDLHIIEEGKARHAQLCGDRVELSRLRGSSVSESD